MPLWYLRIWWKLKDLNLRTLRGRFYRPFALTTCINFHWSRWQDSNLRPLSSKPSALNQTELHQERGLSPQMLSLSIHILRRETFLRTPLIFFYPYSFTLGYRADPYGLWKLSQAIYSVLFLLVTEAGIEPTKSRLWA